MEREKTLSPSEVCEKLQISRSTLDKWAKKGTIKPVERLPSGYRRYSDRDVEALAESIKVPLEPEEK